MKYLLLLMLILSSFYSQGQKDNEYATISIGSGIWLPIGDFNKRHSTPATDGYGTIGYSLDLDCNMKLYKRFFLSTHISKANVLTDYSHYQQDFYKGIISYENTPWKVKSLQVGIGYTFMRRRKLDLAFYMRGGHIRLNQDTRLESHYVVDYTQPNKLVKENYYFERVELLSSSAEFGLLMTYYAKKNFVIKSQLNFNNSGYSYWRSGASGYGDDYFTANLNIPDIVNIFNVLSLDIGLGYKLYK